MGYALFAARKQVLGAQLQSAQLQQTQRSDEQFFLATQQSNLKMKMSTFQSAQAGEMADLYKKLSEADGTKQRDQINDAIHQKESEFKRQLEDVNREIYEISMQENAIQSEVKRLDTVVSALQQQLQQMEQAEGQAIERATPKFGGLG